MAFVLGLLVAGLAVLLVSPAIWRRAMRLARNRIEASVPLSRAEVAAEKDQLRASFAVSNRRLEMQAERLRQRLAEESITHSRQGTEVAALAREKEVLTETIATLETRVSGLSESLSATETRLTAAAAEIAERDATLAEREAALADLRSERDAAQLMSEELRLEMVARQTEITNLSVALADHTATERAMAGERDGLAAELAAERATLAGEEARLEALEASFAVLQTERTGRLAELERRAAEVKSLEAELASERAAREALAAEADGVRADRARLVAELSERGAEIARLSAGLNETMRHRDTLMERLEAAGLPLPEMGEAMAQAGPAGEGDNLRKALAATEAQNTELAERVSAMEQDLDALRTENAELRRVAGGAWESDREENRQLRERLEEIAAGVVRLTQSAESNGNGNRAPAASSPPVEPIPMPQRPAATVAPGEGSDPPLADRLRALQHAARH